MLTNDKEKVRDNSSKLQKQLEDRRKSRLVVDTEISSTVEGYEARLKDLNQLINDLEEEVRENTTIPTTSLKSVLSGFAQFMKIRGKNFQIVRKIMEIGV